MAEFSITILPILGLFLFVIAFATVVFFTFRFRSKNFYEEMGRIPLQNDE